MVTQTTTTMAGAAGTETAPSLGALLDDTSVVADTDAALTALFARWHKDYNELTGATGCERAEKAGLRCIYASGNWNNLRELNRPTVVELLGQSGRRHQVLITSFK